MKNILKIIVVLLPIGAYAGEPIRIDFNYVRPTIGTPVPVSGEFTAPISETDMEFFDLTEDSLIKSIAQYNGNKAGGTPADVSVTPKSVNGKQFAEFSYKGVKPLSVTIRPVSAKVIDVNRGRKEKVTLYVFRFVNKNSNRVSYDIETTHVGEKKTEFTWSFTEKKTLSASLQIGLKYVAGKLSMSRTNTWGEDKTVAEEHIFTVSDKISMGLNAGNASKVTMKAKNVGVEMEIIYEVFLTGYCMGNYPEKFENRHFFFYPIEVLPGIQWKKIVTQNIKVVHSSDLIVRGALKSLNDDADDED
nr:venom protein U-MPTX.8-32 [Megalopyge opercularis]